MNSEDKPIPAEAATEIGNEEEDLDDFSWRIVKLFAVAFVVITIFGLLWRK